MVLKDFLKSISHRFEESINEYFENKKFKNNRFSLDGDKI